MLNTRKSITNNFKKCCLKEAEQLSNIYLCKSTSLKKKFILAYTTENRFLMGSAKTFGKMVLLDEFVPKDVKSIEMRVKTGLTPKYTIKINYKGKEDIFNFIMMLGEYRQFYPHPRLIMKLIYGQAPDSKPSYLKDLFYVDSIAVKSDSQFIFTDKKLLLLNFDGKNMSVKEEIDNSKITDYDIYSQNIGQYQNFYLEVDSKPKLYSVSLATEFENYIDYLYGIFNFTNIPKSVPSYMDDDEQEIVTFNITETQFEAGLGKRRMRVASRNVFLLEKHKDGKLVPYKKIPISEIESIKADTLGTALKSGSNSKKHEIIIKTKDGKKTRIWNNDTATNSANKAIDYIRQNIS